MQHNELWWHGRAWLSEGLNHWPNNIEEMLEGSIPERRQNVIIINHAANADEILNKYSSFTRLVRVIALCKSFEHNATSKKPNRQIRPITSLEFKQSTISPAKLVQASAFQQELHDFEQRNQISTKSKLVCLSPCLDEEGLIGGRLKHSNLKYDQKHLILLPAKHPFIY